MGKHKAEVLFVHLPSTLDGSYLQVIDRLVASARLDGQKVALIIDYHVQNPYHGVPPHIDVTAGGTQTMTANKARRMESLGYAPFAWKEGWVWARDQIGMLIQRYDPDYIQQADDNALRVGWSITAGKPHWFYNDTMTIFEQAAADTGWRGIFVVEGWKTSMHKAREKFGKDRVLWHEDLVDVVVDTVEEPPPPPDDCGVLYEDCVAELEESDELANALGEANAELAERNAQLENDLWMCNSENAQLRAALQECTESPCVCEDCDEKYQGLQDSLDDLLDILWAFIGGRS